MKVFWLNNQTKERDIPMYRGHKELMNISTLNVKEQSPFNYLTIANPDSSCCICTLYDFRLGACDINTIGLHMFDNLNITNKSKEIGILHVNCMANKDFMPKHTELSTINNIQNNDIDLFYNHYSILLPGGGFIIEFDKGIYEITLDICWSAEVL